jgi:hypothetical protein
VTPIRSDVNPGCPANFHPSRVPAQPTSKVSGDCHGLISRWRFVEQNGFGFEVGQEAFAAGPAPWKPIIGISGPTTLPIEFRGATDKLRGISTE